MDLLAGEDQRCHHRSNTMLTTNLSRARRELQAHRSWLRTFSLRSNASSFSTTAQKQDGPTIRKTFKRPNDSLPHRPRPKGKKWQHIQELKKERETSIADPQVAAAQGQIVTACKESNFDAAMDAYRTIPDKTLLYSPVLHKLTQGMAFWAKLQLSVNKKEQDQERSEKLQQYAEELVRDIRNKSLGPRATASSHLLQFFTANRAWDVGTKFWKWLEAQEDEYVNDSVYGAAISLRAAQDAKLEDLETLYQQGLARFSHGFAEYHLSPGAIVPNRDSWYQLTNVPYALVQGIMAARLMRGDSQNAYLALDAVTRIRPAGVDAAFFLEVLKERPISEAYTVFAMACRTGSPLNASAYRTLLSTLRTNADTEDPTRFVLAIRAMLSATYLHIGGGGTLNRNSVTEIVISLTNLVRTKGAMSMSDEDRTRLCQAVQDLIAKTIELAARFSTGPNIAAYNSIVTNIAAASAGQVETVITTTMKEALSFGLEPTIVTRRSIIVAAASAKNPGLLERAWRWLVEARAREGQLPDATDLHILTKACVQAGRAGFALDVIGNASHLQDWQRENLLERVEKLADLQTNTDEPADIDELLAQVAKIKADLEVFDERTSDARGVQDFSSQVVPMLLFPPQRDIRLPEAEMRKLYDQLTTDPTAQTNSEEKPAFSFLTRVPVGQLRYEHWKLITYLMAEAEAHNKAYVNAVDSALAQGERPPQRNYGELFKGEEKVNGVGLSDPIQEIDCQDVDVEKARARICELRKVPVPQEAV